MTTFRFLFPVFVVAFIIILFSSLWFFLSCIETITPGASTDTAIDRASYQVRTYMDGVDCRGHFGTRRFGFMTFSKNQHFVFDAEINKKRWAGVGGWARRWQQWGHSGELGSSDVNTHVD